MPRASRSETASGSSAVKLRDAVLHLTQNRSLRRRARPDHLADDSVVPVHDPALLGNRLLDQETKLRRGARLPVLLPVECIDLDMTGLEELGELSSKRGLPTAARSHHHHSIELTWGRMLHGPPC